MAKRRRTQTKNSIERRIKEGRGSGHFDQYKPWLTIHDVPSKGVVTRIKGWKTNRLHHFFSEHFELAYFYQMEWEMDVLDIREQFPLLPLEKTLYIAEEMGVKHPAHPKTKEPIVMTTDMLLTVGVGDQIRYQAHSIKPSTLLNKRVIEKLEIERRFFQDSNIEWKLITENQINYNLSKNVEWLHGSKTLDDMPHITLKLIEEKAEQIFNDFQHNDKQPMAKVTLQQDYEKTLPYGTTMFIVKHLLANRYWFVDMNKPINPTMEPICLMNGGVEINGVIR